MQLSKKAIQDFQKIYHEEFDVELSDADANSKGIQLLKLMNLVYKPIPVQQGYKDEKPQPNFGN